MVIRWLLKFSCISTHTPVKGVTALQEHNGKYSGISTHTPVKGVTFFRRGQRMVG